MARRFSDEWISRTLARLEPLLSRPRATARLSAADLYGLLVSLEDARSRLLRFELDSSLCAAKRARAPTPVRPRPRLGRGTLRGLRTEAPAPPGLDIPDLDD